MVPALPSDAAEWIALFCAVLAFGAVALSRKSLSTFGSDRTFRFVAALAALVLSALYVIVYLRGGPRIIDATTYFLEGRAFSEGHLAWNVGHVPASTMGRFLVRHTLGVGDHASGIFPPGYPALLALGFLVHAPLAVGPVLAAILVLLTFDLGKTAVSVVPNLSATDRDAIPRIAALLSVVCGTLRYHTADTMSHGLAAVCLTAALTCAFRLQNKPLSNTSPTKSESSRSTFLTATALGLALGWLFATRPVSGLAGLFLVGLVLGRRLFSMRVVGPAMVGALPPIALFLIQQHAATGAWLASSQRLYYEVSDGPSGCFDYGFGARIGCHIEHGDFVAHNLPRGFGLVSAVATTLRRLKMHLADPLNAAPLALVVLVALFVSFRVRDLRALALSLPVFALAYLPFYFDGNYPGGGARFFADQLPVEHVLVAIGIPLCLRHVPSRATQRRFDVSTIGVGIVGLTLLGFAFFGGRDHALLRDREGGHPMFEASVLADARVTSGLVFVDTDHGFDLGFDPDESAQRGIEVARFRGDANDRWLWEERDRPNAYRYEYSFDDTSPEHARITPFEPPISNVLEAENLWPPLAQNDGYVVPEFHTCASGGRWLHLIHDDDHRLHSVRLALPKRVGGTRLAPRVAIASSAPVEVSLYADRETVGRWSMDSRAQHEETCGDLTLIELEPVVVPSSANAYFLDFSDVAGAKAEGDVGTFIALDALLIEENR